MTFPILSANGPSGYNLTRSLRFRASATANLSRTPSVAATSNKIFTISFWMKPSLLVSTSYIWILDCASQDFGFYLNANYTASFQLSGGANYITTSQVFRDPAAWYHMVIAVDTTQATAANRLKFYVNGSQVTAFSSASYPAQNTTFAWNQNGQVQYFGRNSANSAFLYDGYLTEIYNIDGQALTPSSFGSTNTLTGVWQPAQHVGTYGTNGFYLPFTDNSALTTSSNVGLGKDFSGNGNYFTTNNISITSGVTYDSMTDVPTLTSATAANFAVLNPLENVNSTYMAFQNGNLRANMGTGAATMCWATVVMPTNKWYWEVTITTVSNGTAVGISYGSNTISDGNAKGITYAFNGNKRVLTVDSSYGATYTTGDVIGIAVDKAASTVTFYKNNSSQGAISDATIATQDYRAMIHNNTSSGSGLYDINFGQRPFAYTPPTGFVALNTFNLPTSTIVKGNTAVAIALNTPSGAGSVTGIAFQPDVVWLKSRNIVENHNVYDSVRGATKVIAPNSTAAEVTISTGVTSFDASGFTFGSGAYSSGQPYVNWLWKAGQGTNTTNTSGTITSTVSVNASAGFSIATYTGTGVNATVGHGLGVTPKFLITKDRSGGGSWQVYHDFLGNTGGLYLNLANAFTSSSGWWNNTSPTSTTISIGTNGEINTNGRNYVAYCWTPIAGYSAFGSWQNNNSTDGTFVYLGFSPAVIILKNSDNAENWYFRDIARQTYNVTPPSNIWLQPSTSNTEAANGATTAEIDVLSNGFKIRTTNPAAGEISFGTRTYIYGAWAANPFKNSLAR